MAPPDELKKRTEEALFSNIASRANGGLVLSKYPEDVRPVFQELYRLWGISPPDFKGNASKNSRAADWIAGARELLATCEEFGLSALETYYKEWHAGMVANKRRTGIGTAPHTVSRPGSLINPIAGKIGEWRVQSREPSQDNSATPPAIQGLMGKVRLGDKLYIDGKEIVDERPQENNARSWNTEKIYNFIRDFWARKKMPPSIRDIVDGCKISSTSIVAYHLAILQRGTTGWDRA